jgi:tetratricopeptide (TPR) repeat protein
MQRVVVHMICNNCGHQIRTRKKYCTACGAALPKQVNLLFLWAIPVITALLVMSSVVSYTLYEEKVVNPRVQSNIERGEESFIIGEFTEAKAHFEEAKKDRPNNAVVKQNILLVEEAMKIEKKVKHLKQALREESVKNPDEAISQIENDLIEISSEPLYAYFSEEIKMLKDKIVLLEIENTIDETKSVTAFAKLFSNLSYYHSEEANVLKEKLTIAFTNFVIFEAKKAIASNDYGKANIIVEFALQYDFENDELATFMKNSIQPYLKNE